MVLTLTVDMSEWALWCIGLSVLISGGTLWLLGAIGGDSF